MRTLVARLKILNAFMCVSIRARCSAYFSLYVKENISYSALLSTTSYVIYVSFDGIQLLLLLLLLCKNTLYDRGLCIESVKCADEKEINK